MTSGPEKLSSPFRSLSRNLAPFSDHFLFPTHSASFSPSSPFLPFPPSLFASAHRHEPRAQRTRRERCRWEAGAVRRSRGPPRRRGAACLGAPSWWPCARSGPAGAVQQAGAIGSAAASWPARVRRRRRWQEPTRTPGQCCQRSSPCADAKP
jgi:hypothetical protein